MKSCLEERLMEQIYAAGLPLPKTEFRFAPPRLWRADMIFDLQRVIVEVQGGTWLRIGHCSGKQYQSDCDKLFEAQMMGYLVVWVTGDEIGRTVRGVWVPDSRAITKIRRALENGPKRLRREVCISGREAPEGADP